MQAAHRWLLTLCAVPSLLLGQTPGRVLKAGDRVRIIARADTGIYTVRAVSHDTLTVELPESAALAYFPVSALRRVDSVTGERSVPPWRCDVVYSDCWAEPLSAGYSALRAATTHSAIRSRA